MQKDSKFSKKRTVELSDKILKFLTSPKIDIEVREALSALCLTTYIIAQQCTETEHEANQYYMKAIMLKPFQNKKGKLLTKMYEQKSIGDMFQ